MRAASQNKHMKNTYLEQNISSAEIEKSSKSTTQFMKQVLMDMVLFMIPYYLQFSFHEAFSWCAGF